MARLVNQPSGTLPPPTSVYKLVIYTRIVFKVATLQLPQVGICQQQVTITNPKFIHI